MTLPALLSTVTMSTTSTSSPAPSSVYSSDTPSYYESEETAVVTKKRKRRRKKKRGRPRKDAQHDINVVSAAVGSRRRKGDRSLFPSDKEVEKKAAFRKSIGASREKGVIRTEALRPHPSRGGSTGYSMDFRLTAIAYYDAGYEVDPSLVRSIQRWKKKGVIPKKQTGIKRRLSLRESIFSSLLHTNVSSPKQQQNNVLSSYLSTQPMDVYTPIQRYATL